MIYPNHHELIFADKVAYGTHANFSLDGKGEQILLFSPDLVLADSITFGQQYPDISYGRYPDGSQNWYYFQDDSPSSDNSPDHLLTVSFAELPRFSIEGGYYTGNQVITLTTPSPSAVIRYTLNGSDPTSESAIYTNPITISSTTVIRARAFQYGTFTSLPVTHTYILDKEITLPVISIATDGKYLWNDRIGIYVEGTNGILGNCAETPRNYNQDWERPVNVEFYDQNGISGFNQLAGTKIFGACSRRAEQKSMSLFARGKYGKNSFDYKLFEDKDLNEFKSFIIRNSGNDIRHTMLRDGMMQTLVKDRMDLDYQEYQPAIIYLNGEYWGILNIREKINEDYLEANHGVDRDSVDMLYKYVYVVEGQDTHYLDMMDFIRSNDMSDSANYEYVGRQMDINQFLNYYIAEIYFFNQDWPQGNIKYWRPQTPEGRWRWLMYDLDFGFDFLKYEDNMVGWATTGSEESTELFRNLVVNTHFRNEFLQRFCSHMNTSFLPDRVIGIIDSLAGNIETEMPYHIDKFNWPRSFSRWYEELDILTDFASTRLPELRTNLLNRFNLEGMYELTSVVSNPGFGSIQISGVEVPDTLSGSYFINLPVSVVAVPKEGYAFLGWEGASSSSDHSIELTGSSDDTLIAHFGALEPISALHLNEISSSGANAIPDEYGELSDWIEVYNSGSEPIQLAGLYITDSIQHPDKHLIPFIDSKRTVVHPDSSLVLYADNDIQQGPLHLNFRLSNQGESLLLSQKIGDEFIILDSISYTKQLAGITTGRIPDGTGKWKLTVPTPNGFNAGIPFYSGILINEFSASNRSLPDDHGEYEDWIEIYNGNDYSVDIGGLYLTDSLANRTKHRIPITSPDSTTIPPKGFLVLWADNQPEQGVLHLGFGLRRGGEQLGFVQYDGLGYIDSLTFGEQYSASSVSRYPDGQDQWQHLPSSPGSENTSTSVTGLYINEFSSSNRSSITDEYGEYEDWIEIYNSHTDSIDVGGLFITDSLAYGMRYRIPSTSPDSTTIPPGGYLVLWADNEPDQGILHVGFGIRRSGEQIGLVHYDGSTFIDSLTFGSQYINASVSRYPDGESNWLYLPSTPGDTNRYTPLSGLRINEFSASNESFFSDDFGEYEDWIEIYNDNVFEVDIGGLFITDSLGNGMRHRIPTTEPGSTVVPPKSYIVLWADNQPYQGVLHLDFGLSRKGEQIGLVQYNGTDFIDSVTFEPQYLNASLSRYPEKNNLWLSVPSTPGDDNYTGTVSGVIINEFSSSNQLIQEDNYGEFEDWIELYNDNDEPVDIGGLFFTDTLGFGMKTRIPTTAPDSTTIPPKGYLLLWADNQKDQGVLHLGFGLRRSGEQAGLAQYDGVTFIDSLTYDEQYKNASVSRFPDGDNNWYHLPATPGYGNVYERVSGLFINEFSSSNRYLMKDNFGEYDDWIEIYNENDEPVDLGGLFITDSLANGARFRIPTTAPDSTTIPPRGYLVLWADKQEEQGVQHLSFGLTREGEQIGLLQYDAVDYIDTLTYPEIMVNTSLSRYPDGNGSWISMNSTPGFSNTKNEYRRLFINEFRAGQWIELFNYNDYPVNIAGLYVTDSLQDPGKYQIPHTTPDSTTIPSNGYLLLWPDAHTELGVLHLNFTMDPSGGEFGLSRKVNDRYLYIDSLVYTYQHTSVSTGRVNDGVNSWTHFTSPTPGRSNSAKLTATPAVEVSDFMVYPNPVSGGVLHFNQLRNVKLYNKLGHLIQEANDTSHLIVTNLQAGLYILVTDQGEVFKVVINPS